jgi:hypothetical protein
VEDNVLFKLPTPFFVRSINLLARHAVNQCTVFSIKFPTTMNIQVNLRKVPGYTVPGPRGAHFSYLNFDSKLLRTKYSSFAHTEMDRVQFSSQELVAFCEKYQISLRGGTHSAGFGLLKSISSQENEVVAYFSDVLNYSLKAPTDEPTFLRIMASEYVTRLVVGRFVPNLNSFYSPVVLTFLCMSFCFRWLLNEFRRFMCFFAR